GKPTSSGDKGQLGGRNSPTTYNAALHIAQFWDGRAADVEAQAKGPILNPVEMAMPDAATVVKTLKAIPGYAELFAAAFPDDKDPINYDNLGKAIGAFERKLVTPAPFDRFIAGDLTALNEAQLTGFNTFVDSGCASCHNGVGAGGGMYQKLGLVKPFATTDTGREEATHNEADKFFFKVPSLRNIEKTGPYFHDGKVATLEDAIRLMAEHQLGRTLTDQQISEIRAFLSSLTGTLPTELIAVPALPGVSPVSGT
ncbi:MAG: cytochrome c peroxidase, partial [Gammaproteobacteria bacterium]